jgi:hypothetical protein
MHKRPAIRPACESRPIRKQPFGWVVLGTLLGAIAACAPAEVPQVDELREYLRRAVLEMAPFLVVGSIGGAVLGWQAEELLRPHLSLTRAAVYGGVAAAAIAIPITRTVLAPVTGAVFIVSVVQYLNWRDERRAQNSPQSLRERRTDARPE